MWMKTCDDMPAFFNSIDIFLLTSRYEGFSNVIPEAMASGKPVISFDIRSSGEIIQDGITGFITEPNDLKQMADRIIELAGNRRLMEEMGRNGRKRIEEFFTFEKVQEEIMELITHSG
jgi:glycosyltransferase involved in cell wall biosynthesis